ncbi:hypothetical protein BH09VER1_BH09VER1_42620 [soil metagenome]
MPATEPTSRLSRKEMIAARLERSRAWRVIHTLGSLKMALVLLATIGISIAVATFLESSSGTKAAHALVYKAWWFHLVLFVLCVNLAAVTLTRWPWQKKHIGFVVTHYGIITLLCGAVIGLRTGFEGNVTLEKDAPPISRVTVPHSLLQLQSPADPNALYRISFDAEMSKPTEKHPLTFPVPLSELKIVADGYHANVVQVPKFEPATGAEAGPSVLLTLSNKAGKTFPIALSLAPGRAFEDHFFGLADLTLRKDLPGEAATGEQETQIIFAKFAPVVQSAAHPSGVVALLSQDGATVVIQGEAHPRGELMDQPVTIGDAQVIVEKYWPDFAMENGRPTSVSENVNNPAALIRITQISKKPSLELAITGSNVVSYQLRRGGAIYASGTATPGTDLTLQWADWHARFDQILPSATLTTETQPGPELAKGQPSNPGFRAHLVDAKGQRGPDRWIASGEITSLTDGQNVIRLAYGLESRPLPFTLRLVKFEVPRDEGTDKPANFLATVEFRDLKTGATKTGVAEMNHPASFPGTLFATFTGLNYKFSQAEWNPRDLDQTTLQVLYDPGWLLKWVGSLGICLGIAIMFYWKPGGA